MAFKTCTCGEKVGVRARQCKKCKTIFPTKSKREKELKQRGEEVEDWKSLEIGSKIKVIGGSGPYYSYIKDGKECIDYLGCDPGNYILKSIVKDGIFVTDGSIRYYVYLGEVKPGIVGVKAPHKIRKLK